LKIINKKCLKISKVLSESINRRKTDNTMPKRKVQRDKHRSTKHTYKTKDRVTRTPLKTGSKLRGFAKVSNSCLTSGTSHVNLVTNYKQWIIEIYYPCNDIEDSCHYLSVCWPIGTRWSFVRSFVLHVRRCWIRWQFVRSFVLHVRQCWIRWRFVRSFVLHVRQCWIRWRFERSFVLHARQCWVRWCF
jgi:hypothetical protein